MQKSLFGGCKYIYCVRVSKPITQWASIKHSLQIISLHIVLSLSCNLHYFPILCKYISLNLFCQPFLTLTPPTIYSSPTLLLFSDKILKCKSTRADEMHGTGQKMSHMELMGYFVTSQSIQLCSNKHGSGREDHPQLQLIMLVTHPQQGKQKGFRNWKKKYPAPGITTTWRDR